MSAWPADGFYSSMDWWRLSSALKTWRTKLSKVWPGLAWQNTTPKPDDLELENLFVLATPADGAADRRGRQHDPGGIFWRFGPRSSPGDFLSRRDAGGLIRGAAGRHFGHRPCGCLVLLLDPAELHLSGRTAGHDCLFNWLHDDFRCLRGYAPSAVAGGTFCQRFRAGMNHRSSFLFLTPNPKCPSGRQSVGELKFLRLDCRHSADVKVTFVYADESPPAGLQGRVDLCHRGWPFLCRRQEDPSLTPQCYGHDQQFFQPRTVHAAWRLLPVDAKFDCPAHPLRCRHRAGLLLDPVHAALFCEEAEGFEISLDLCVLCRIRAGLPHHAFDGNMEHLARGLLAVRLHQGHHGADVGAHRVSAHQIGSAGARPAQCGGPAKSPRRTGNPGAGADRKST